MKRKNTILLLLTILIFGSIFAQDTTSESGWYKADRVIAMVNSDPILQSELDARLEIEKGRPKPKDQFELIDSFINDKLLYQAADRESIIVSDKKVESHIDELMQFYGAPSREAFIKTIEDQEKVPFEVYREEVRKKLVIEQLMVYAMDYVPPTEGDAREWYEEHKKSMLEVRFQHILIRPKDTSFSAEKEANTIIDNLRGRIEGGESFGRLARQFSQDKSSASNNGIIGWTSFAQVDREIVGYVYNMNNAGQVSPVFKTPSGYHIIKYLGRRYRPYEELRDRIFQMISQQARMQQFEEWIEERRSVSDIQVFIPGYDEYKKKRDDEKQLSDTN